MDSKKIAARIGRVAGVILIALLIGFVWFRFGSSSCSRQLTRMESEYGRGVLREVTLYTASGEQIGHWEGRIDVEYIADRVDLVFFNEYGIASDRVVINPGSGSLVVDETD